jgi:hypothetical protein
MTSEEFDKATLPGTRNIAIFDEATPSLPAGDKFVPHPLRLACCAQWCNRSMTGGSSAWSSRRKGKTQPWKMLSRGLFIHLFVISIHSPPPVDKRQLATGCESVSRLAEIVRFGQSSGRSTALRELSRDVWLSSQQTFASIPSANRV